MHLILFIYLLHFYAHSKRTLERKKRNRIISVVDCNDMTMTTTTAAAANERLTIYCVFFFSFARLLNDWTERKPKIELKCVRLCLFFGSFWHLYAACVPEYSFICLGVLRLSALYAAWYVEEETQWGQENERDYHSSWISSHSFARTACPQYTLAHGEQMAVSCLFSLSLHTHTHAAFALRLQRLPFPTLFIRSLLLHSQ